MKNSYRIGLRIMQESSNSAINNQKKTLNETSLDVLQIDYRICKQMMAQFTHRKQVDPTYYYDEKIKINYEKAVKIYKENRTYQVRKCNTCFPKYV